MLFSAILSVYKERIREEVNSMEDIGYAIVSFGIIMAMYYGSYRMIKNFVTDTKKNFPKTMATIFGIAIAGGIIYLAASELHKKVELFI